MQSFALLYYTVEHFNTKEASAVQYSAEQYSAVQYSAEKYSAVQHMIYNIVELCIRGCPPTVKSLCEMENSQGILLQTDRGRLGFAFLLELNNFFFFNFNFSI